MGDNISKAYEYNIDKSRKLLELTKVPNIVESIDQFIDNRPRFLPQMDAVADSLKAQLKGPITEHFKRLNEISFELSLVAAVIAYETYLRDRYMERKEIETYNGPPFQNLEVAKTKYGEIGIENLVSPEIEKKLIQILQLRHVIIHRAGIIDEKAANNADWGEDAIGEHVKNYLKYDSVLSAIKTIESIVNYLEERLGKKIELISTVDE